MLMMCQCDKAMPSIILPHDLGLVKTVRLCWLRNISFFLSELYSTLTNSKHSSLPAFPSLKSACCARDLE